MRVQGMGGESCLDYSNSSDFVHCQGTIIYGNISTYFNCLYLKSLTSAPQYNHGDATAANHAVMRASSHRYGSTRFLWEDQPFSETSSFIARWSLTGLLIYPLFFSFFFCSVFASTWPSSSWRRWASSSSMSWRWSYTWHTAGKSSAIYTDLVSICHVLLDAGQSQQLATKVTYAAPVTTILFYKSVTTCVGLLSMSDSLVSQALLQK